MKIQLHTIIAGSDKEISITNGDKIQASIKDVDKELLDLIKECQHDFLKRLEDQAQRLGYQVALRTAPLFPVPDHP